MAEPDHIFVNPLPNLSNEGYPAAFPFFYIKPDQNEKVLRKFFPKEYGPVTNIDPIGNSPVIIRKVIGRLTPFNMIFSFPCCHSCKVLFFLLTRRLLFDVLYRFCLSGFAGKDCSYMDECFIEDERGSRGG